MVIYNGYVTNLVVNKHKMELNSINSFRKKISGLQNVTGAGICLAFVQILIACTTYIHDQCGVNYVSMHWRVECVSNKVDHKH